MKYLILLICLLFIGCDNLEIKKSPRPQNNKNSDDVIIIPHPSGDGTFLVF